MQKSGSQFRHCGIVVATAMTIAASGLSSRIDAGLIETAVLQNVVLQDGSTVSGAFSFEPSLGIITSSSVILNGTVPPGGPYLLISPPGASFVTPVPSLGQVDFTLSDSFLNHVSLNITAPTTNFYSLGVPSGTYSLAPSYSTYNLGQTIPYSDRQYYIPVTGSLQISGGPGSGGGGSGGSGGTSPTPPPSTAVLAQLSSNVYSGVAGAGGYAAVAVNTQLPDQALYQGFRAVAFASPDNAQVVIAFRGTDVSGYVNGLKTGIADESFKGDTPTDDLVKSVTYAGEFLNSIEQRFPDAAITLTGHSLGGAIAQILGDATEFRTVSFNAPGPHNLYDALIPTLAKGFVIPDPSHGTGTITNYRIYGDQISLIGSQIGDTVILPAPQGTSFSFSGSSEQILMAEINTFGKMHGIDTVIQQINEQPVSGAGEPNVADALVSAVQPNQIAGLDLFFLTVVAKGVEKLFDPSSASDYLFLANPGSPNFASIDLPAMPGVESWLLRYEIGSDWSAYQSVLPGAVLDFGSGVDGIEFAPIGADGQPMKLTDSLLFDVTFASDGTFSGVLQQSSDATASVPEPSSIAMATGCICVILCLKSVRRRARASDKSA